MSGQVGDRLGDLPGSILLKYNDFWSMVAGDKYPTNCGSQALRIRADAPTSENGLWLVNNKNGLTG